MAGALDGIRVVDFGQYVAGPLAAMLLADQGADVVHVDPPGGPRWDTPANATWHRGKRATVLDLKQERDRDVARTLIAGADVVIENFRPGVMDRLGLGAAAMTEAHPHLVYCSLPGFASDDPRTGVAAWEPVLGAATATYTTKRRAAEQADARPVYTPIPIASSFAAFLGATSVTMALIARERDGRGQRIEVPLFDATFTAIGIDGMQTHGRTLDPPVPNPGWVGQYECADGRWIQFHGTTQKFVDQVVAAAGLEAWRAGGLTDRNTVRNDPALDAELRERLTALFKTRTGLEWEELVNAAGTPCSICRDSAEWLDHPHARSSKAVIEVGSMLQPGIHPRLDATPGEVRTPAPTPEDAARLLIAWPPPPPAGEGGGGGSEALPALDGIRVIDLTIILAGPTCGRTLAEFGADVIKVDDPNRDEGIVNTTKGSLPPRAALTHNDVNRGKRSLLLDLKRPEGLEVFWRLVERADVVLQNFRAGVAERLGIGYEEARKRRPDLVYVSLNAYGHGGPWEGRPGYEMLAQAATGMQRRFGGDGKPVIQPFPVNDYGTGVLTAYGVALALLHRKRTGEGQHVRSALAYTAGLLQSPFMQGYEGKTWDEPRGQDALGWGPLQRLYRASDGWFALGACEDQLPHLARIEGLAGIEALRGADLEAALEQRFARAPAEVWVERLLAAGLGATRTAVTADLMADQWVEAHGLSLTRDHEGFGLLTTTGPAARLSRTPVDPRFPARPPGSDASAILEEHGLGADFERLVAAGVVVVP